MAKENSILEKIKEGIEGAVEKVEDVVLDGVEKVEEVISEGIEKAEDVMGLKESKTEKNNLKKVEKEGKIKKTVKKAKKKEEAEEKKSVKKVSKKVEKEEGEVVELEDKEEVTKDDFAVRVEDGGDIKSETVLTSIEDYIKTASYLGTKVITPTMRKYVYRRRLDGLAILNTLLVDKKLAEAIDFIKQYKPDEWTLICKREAGWRAAKMFSELTGVRLFTKKYPAGVLTNTELDNFIETKMVMICDPWLDKNALKDSRKMKVPVCGICDTNNHTFNIDVVIIANNKSNKSLGLVFWLLAREYMKAHGIDKKLPSLEDFVGEELVLEEPRKKKKLKEKKEKDLKAAESAIEERMRQIAESADEEVKESLNKEEGSDEESIKVSEGAEEGV